MRLPGVPLQRHEHEYAKRNNNYATRLRPRTAPVPGQSGTLHPAEIKRPRRSSLDSQPGRAARACSARACSARACSVGSAGHPRYRANPKYRVQLLRSERPVGHRYRAEHLRVELDLIERNTVGDAKIEMLAHRAHLHHCQADSRDLDYKVTTHAMPPA